MPEDEVIDEEMIDLDDGIDFADDLDLGDDNLIVGKGEEEDLMNEMD
ncbi:MAG: hypothetical protein Q7K40_01835 [bacterium]|nr:hypothetical protein [bacterium]